MLQATPTFPSRLVSSHLVSPETTKNGAKRKDNGFHRLPFINCALLVRVSVREREEILFLFLFRLQNEANTKIVQYLLKLGASCYAFALFY